MRNGKPSPTWRRSGFTLMELMVAVAILLAVLVLIGTIFATASKAGGNATSMTTLHRQLAQVADLIQRDLAYTVPGPSGFPIGIAGMVIDTPATERERESGIAKPHRADMLMLFTTAEQDPYVYEGVPPVDLAPMAQVVYGQADIATWVPVGNSWDLQTKVAIENMPASVPARLPASQWHLSRRQIHFLDGASGPYPGAGLGILPYATPLTNQDFLKGYADLLWQPGSEIVDLFPASTVLQFWNGQLTSNPDLYPVPAAFSFLTKDFILQPNGWFGMGTDGRWWSVSGTQWTRQEVPDTPQVISDVAPTSAAITDLTQRVWDVLYNPSASASVPRRSVVDPQPPLGMPKPVAWSLLQGCSEFKVEYTYDDPRELNWTLQNSTPVLDVIPRPIRWHSVPSGGQIMWSKVSVDPSNPTDPRRWPRALRVTLKAWDKGDRLTEPVTRTIIHAW